MVRPSIFTKNILLFSALSIMCVLLGACLNPTGVSNVVDRSTVNLYYHHGHLRSGDERIYGLRPEKYYLIEILERGVSQGIWFINSNGELTPHFHEIGTVSGGEITGLSNDPDFLHIVRYAQVLNGYVTHFDGPIPTARAVTERARSNGELWLSAPPNTGDRYFLDLSPAHIAAGNRALDYTLAAYYTILGIPVPAAPRQTFDPIIGHPFIIPLHTEAHTAPHTIDYLFAQRRRDAEGNFHFIRDGFYVLRVVPTFSVDLTVIPLPFEIEDMSPTLQDDVPTVHVSVGAIGTPLFPHLIIRIANYYDFTEIRMEDELGNTFQHTAGAFTLDFTNTLVRNRYNIMGDHLFTIIGLRENRPWSAEFLLRVVPDP